MVISCISFICYSNVKSPLFIFRSILSFSRIHCCKLIIYRHLQLFTCEIINKKFKVRVKIIRARSQVNFRHFWLYRNGYKILTLGCQVCHHNFFNDNIFSIRSARAIKVIKMSITTIIKLIKKNLERLSFAHVSEFIEFITLAKNILRDITVVLFSVFFKKLTLLWIVFLFFRKIQNLSSRILEENQHVSVIYVTWGFLLLLHHLESGVILLILFFFVNDFS